MDLVVSINNVTGIIPSMVVHRLRSFLETDLISLVLNLALYSTLLVSKLTDLHTKRPPHHAMTQEESCGGLLGQNEAEEGQADLIRQ